MENKNWKNLSVIQTIKSNMGILAGLVILCVVLSFTTSSFATVTNLFNVVRQITINLFLACGMTFVILLAGIDLWSYVKKKYKLNTTNFLFLCNC